MYTLFLIRVWFCERLYASGHTLTSTCLVFHAGCFLTLTAAAAFLLADFRPAEASPWRQTWCQPGGIADYWRMKFHNVCICSIFLHLEWLLCGYMFSGATNRPVGCSNSCLLKWTGHHTKGDRQNNHPSLCLHIYLCISICAYVWMHIKVPWNPAFQQDTSLHAFE